MKKKLISLHGAYFGYNYGDILLLNIFAKWIKDYSPDIIINLPLADRNKTPDLPEGLSGIMNLFRSKCLIFYGGGYFCERPRLKQHWARRNFKRYGIIGLLARFFQIPYAIIGVEFGPLSVVWFRRICIYLAKHAEIVVVRNQESKIFLNQNGVTNVIQAADAVLSLSEIVQPSHNQAISSEVLVHLHGIGNNVSKYYEIVSIIVDVLNSRKKTYSLGFISDNKEYDYSGIECDKIFELLRDKGVTYNIYKFEGYLDLIKIIRNATYLITNKLHVGITAVALDKRPLSLWTHPKTERFYRQIMNLENCISIYKNDNDLKIAIKKYFDNIEEYRLPDQIRELSNINKKEMIMFLQRHKVY